MKKDIDITPAAFLAAAQGDMENFMVALTPGGIERQEAAGQQEIVKRCDRIPKNMMGDKKEDYEQLGFVFHDDADDIFVNVDMPEGWEIKATEHSMWNELFDAKGRKRASMFYKAAFYDRCAHISLLRRYNARTIPEDEYKTDMTYEKRRAGNWYGVVTDCDKIIYKTRPMKKPEKPDFDEDEKIRSRADKWLKKKYPKWESCLEYWDEANCK